MLYYGGKKSDTTKPQKGATRPGKSYDGSENSKKASLAGENEEPRQVWVPFELAKDEEKLLVETLKSYTNVFAWSYRDLKGVDCAICQHTIPMV